MGLKWDKQLLKKIAKDLSDNRAEESLRIGRELGALIKLRIQNKGLNSKNQKLGKYSQVQLPASFFDDILKTGAKNKVKGKKTLSYEDVRRASNLPIDFVNLTFTGEMWRSTQANLISNSNTTTVVRIEGITRRSQKLLEYNSRRYGDVLAITDKERQMLFDAHRARILNVVRKYLKIK